MEVISQRELQKKNRSCQYFSLFSKPNIACNFTIVVLIADNPTHM